MKPLNSDTLEPDFSVINSTRQNFPPNLYYLSERALQHIKTIQCYKFTYDIKFIYLPAYRNTKS